MYKITCLLWMRVIGHLHNITHSLPRISPVCVDGPHLLRKDLFQSRSVSYYADQLNMSSKKLNMITQEMVNMPVKNYIISSLILEIKRILANSSITVNEVGYEAGFGEPTNFVKFVKKYTHMTPVELRKTLQ